MKIENAEKRRPNLEAIAAYRKSLEAKSGKLEENDTDDTDGEIKDVEEDEENGDLDVLVDDENNNDGEDLEGEGNEDGEKDLENEINDGDEDEAPVVSASNSRKEPALNPLRSQTRKKKIRTVCFRLLSLLIDPYFGFNEERRRP